MTRHPAVANIDFSWRDVWPRRPNRNVTLPPGQRLVRAFPRFGDNPLTPLPALPQPTQLEVRGAVGRPLVIGVDALAELRRVNATTDFHCVTTWSLVGVRWDGWSFADIWNHLILPGAAPSPDASWLVVSGLDGYRAVLHLDDALGDDVLIVDSLEDRPLDLTHGAPLRLLSPGQYAYKSVKHVAVVEVHTQQPSSRLGPKEHPRARVAREERHAKLPAWLLRWPYRLVVPTTAIVARRAARQR